MGVGNHYTSAHLHRVKGVSGDDGVRICDPRGIELIPAVDHEMLIGFEMQKATLSRKTSCQRTFSATGQTAQDYAIKMSFRTHHLHLFYREAATIGIAFTLIGLRFNPCC